MKIIDLYDKVYDEFVDLINDKIDKVVISDKDFYLLDKHRIVKVENNIKFYNNYMDCLRHLCLNKDITQIYDELNHNYIFYKEKLEEK